MRRLSFAFALALALGSGLALHGQSAWADTETALKAAIAAARAATVEIELGDSAGSGVLISAEGLIATAAHVFERPGRRATVRFADGRTESARTLGLSVSGDYGLLQLEGQGPYAFAPTGTTAEFQAASLCFALGHPNSAVERPAPLRVGQRLGDDGLFMQTTAILDRGDSGGPLFDLSGRVVGIHSRIGESLEANYHAPIDLLIKDLESLKRGSVLGDGAFHRHAVIGVRGGPAPGDQGFLVELVFDDLPAAAAGVQIGDVLLTVAGQPVRSIQDIQRIARERRPGDVVPVTVRRSNGEAELAITLAASPSGESGMPTVPGRAPGFMPPWSIQDPRLLGFEDLAASAKQAVVAIIETGELRPRQRLAYGTIVRPEGWLLTKASELKANSLAIVPDGRRLPLRELVRSEADDLALLAIEADPDARFEHLPPHASEIEVGTMLLALYGDRRRPELATVSLGVQGIRGWRAFLGVALADHQAGGTLVERVQPGTPAAGVGLQAGDRLTALDGQPYAHYRDFSLALSLRLPGDKVTLSGIRGETPFEHEVVLAPRPGRATDSRAEADAGTPWLNARRDRFPEAFQHDAMHMGQDVGAPLIDREGRLIGLTIARSERIGALAIPAQRILALLETADAAAAPR